ncbi:hypothetical protein [Desulfobotulus mexicanus]|uniref:hypothetical protein n=1 Tax=Desulfobotulus mexicanus TaxID=2586642 RepID=UPI0015D14668|nr:hypothetical protein [Desulfobotulus mexicanus]
MEREKLRNTIAGKNHRFYFSGGFMELMYSQTGQSKKKNEKNKGYSHGNTKRKAVWKLIFHRFFPEKCSEHFFAPASKIYFTGNKSFLPLWDIHHAEK